MFQVALKAVDIFKGLLSGSIVEVHLMPMDQQKEKLLLQSTIGMSISLSGGHIFML